MRYDHDFAAGDWLAMGLTMALVWVFVALVVVALVRFAWPRAGRPGDDARAILARRLANGEIDVAEYEERLATLRE